MRHSTAMQHQRRPAHPQPRPASGSDAPRPDALVAALAAQRPRLIGLAYRITGSRVDSEDIVQEAWLRARRVDPATINAPEAWLTTVVTHLALDHLKSARVRRESYVGPWLPEPIIAAPGDAASADDPAAAAELAESVTFGFLRLLETLSPLERVVFLLADVFDTPFGEVAAIVDKSPDACRQLASRARRRIRAGDPRHEVPDDAAEVAGEFMGALMAGDVDHVIALMTDDVILVSDGGARAHAARRPVVGPTRVGRFLVNFARRLAAPEFRIEPAVINGEPGLVAWRGDHRLFATAIHVADGRVAAIHSVVNPDKLAALDLTGPIV